jgi:hypothetical protein
MKPAPWRPAHSPATLRFVPQRTSKNLNHVVRVRFGGAVLSFEWVVRRGGTLADKKDRHA